MAAQPDATFAEYLEQVRAHRAELHESVSAVDAALVEEGDRADWLQRLRTAMVELAHDFRDHVELTERPGGLYDTVRSSANRLVPAVDRLADDHTALVEDIAVAIRRLEAMPRGDVLDEVLAQVRSELGGLVERLVRHRKRGGELVHEAFAVDLGGSG
ncbi:hypothetical protein [Ornithinimicrobium tianjinense]|uniref:Hemerythrin HHE cation binding domain-containing protein n=1 Tax=Ornithinimicrobium tianjinense TaxID=1195761 RepID=A0A917BIS6_9MICO|nr:hypothetical protein [Ornithinimicrobium tianjinense]GGF44012.1 hypothetical protein GCM10011366_09710 [Ornithinimicrobium tianjinense]